MAADQSIRRLPPRPEPLTESERRLHNLGRDTFLSLWSYPGVFKDQGTGGGRKGGKEICDLLVVFENDVIIFSDKTCAFPDSGDLNLDWRRWYDRAIKKSVRQVRGAERWLRNHPNRVFVDRGCKHPFPYPFPAQEDARYHRIVVAGGAAERCEREFGGTGSLMIRVGEGAATDPPRPFTLVPLVESDNVVHIFDDVTMALALRVFDTISDFVAYLTAKEEMIRSGQMVFAAGEEDLIERYVKNVDPSGRHGFGIPSKYDGAVIEEGAWLDVESSPQWAAKLAADKVSYAWDEIIEKFTHFATRGESEFANYIDLGDFAGAFGFSAGDESSSNPVPSLLSGDVHQVDEVLTEEVVADDEEADWLALHFGHHAPTLADRSVNELHAAVVTLSNVVEADQCLSVRSISSPYLDPRHLKVGLTPFLHLSVSLLPGLHDLARKAFRGSLVEVGVRKALVADPATPPRRSSALRSRSSRRGGSATASPPARRIRGW